MERGSLYFKMISIKPKKLVRSSVPKKLISIKNVEPDIYNYK